MTYWQSAVYYLYYNAGSVSPLAIVPFLARFNNGANVFPISLLTFKDRKLFGVSHRDFRSRACS
jgi:hypothetical protein